MLVTSSRKPFTQDDLSKAKKKAFDKWASKMNSEFKAYQESRARQTQEQAASQELQRLRDENSKLLQEILVLREQLCYNEPITNKDVEKEDRNEV